MRPMLKKLLVVPMLSLSHPTLTMEKDLKEQINELKKENNELTHEVDSLKKKKKHHHTFTKIKNLLGYSGLIKISPMLGSIVMHRAIGYIKSGHSKRINRPLYYYSFIGTSAALSAFLMQYAMGCVLKSRNNIAISAGIFLTTTFLSGAAMHYSYQRWCNK